LTLRHIALIVLATFVLAACGGSGAAPPTPTPTPGVGAVSGTVSVSVSAAPARARTAARQSSRKLWQAPPGAPLFVADQLLVKIRPGMSPAAAADLHRQLGTTEIRHLRRVDVAVLRITTGEPVPAVIARYRANPAVEYAEPNFYRFLAAAPRPNLVPNDPRYSDQWHYTTISLPAAWDVTTGSALVVVAVIDTGMLFSHVDIGLSILGVVVPGYDFYDDDTNPADPGCESPSDLSHGTHVAGTIAAATNNGVGVAGVNWGGAGRTKIMPIRIFGFYPSIGCTATTADVIDAIEYAADHSARVINMSFGGGGFSASEQAAVDYAYNTGVILFAAAGNSNTNCSTFYPANYANVVGVSATNIADGKAWYSNFGACVDLSAPGGDTTSDVTEGVLSTTGIPALPSQYQYFQGTSMATPHAAGLAALLISKGVTGPASIQNVMQTTADDLGPAGYDTTFGWGRIDAAAAVGVPGPNPMRAFSGVLSGTTITVQSDMVTVATNGTYLVTNAVAGVKSVFAWQDANGNGVIDAGDLYGETPGVIITTGMTTTGVAVSVTERPVGSVPITPSATPARPTRPTRP